MNQINEIEQVGRDNQFVGKIPKQINMIENSWDRNGENGKKICRETLHVKEHLTSGVIIL